MNHEITALATQAFENFQHGLATGDWQAWFRHLSADVKLSFPMGKFRGTHVGQEHAKDFFQFVSKTFPDGLKLELQGVTSNEHTVVFEFRDWGLLGCKPYENRVALALDFADGMVVGYREYFGLLPG